MTKSKSKPPNRELLEVWIFPQLSNISKTGVWQWRANCPAHKDAKASLMIAVTDEQLSLKCAHGCSLLAVCDALSITGKARTEIFPDQHARLFWERQEQLDRDPSEAIQYYRDAIRAGVRLPKDQQTEFRALSARLSKKEKVYAVV